MLRTDLIEHAAVVERDGSGAVVSPLLKPGVVHNGAFQRGCIEVSQRLQRNFVKATHAVVSHRLAVSLQQDCVKPWAEVFDKARPARSASTHQIDLRIARRRPAVVLDHLHSNR